MEIDKKEIALEAIHRFGRVANKVRALERSSRGFDLNDDLQVREIYTIDNIGLNPGITVTELAASMGVTKGAASQVVGSLEKRGYVDKQADPHDGKKIHLALSSKGIGVQERHRLFYEESFARYLHMITPGQILLFSELLMMIEKYLDTTLSE